MRLTLDELEAEQGEIEPFEIELSEGRVVTLPHPKEIPFKSLVGFDAGAPDKVLRALMGDETFDEFAGNKRVTLGVLEGIMNRYYKHYGLGGQGEDGGSPNSSNGSAKRSKRASQRSTPVSA